jgi:ABC-type dipeptide/oligopeptide/nickel transport system ATPase component
MGKIYALQGISGCGKSKTINLVYEKLVKKYNVQPEQIQVFYSDWGDEDIDIIMSGVNGMKIGMESKGDPNSRLEESLEYFEEEGCGIIFCACRTDGMTVRWINERTNYGHEFIPQIPVDAPAMQDQRNNAMALYLIEKAGL